MLELEQALERILATMPVPLSESVATSESFERFLAEKTVSLIDLPPFMNSAMDGYAVPFKDVASAGLDHPVRLKLLGCVPAGKTFAGHLSGQTCVRIFTGTAIPKGADAVVMQEDTRVVPGEPEAVEILEPATPGENVRLQGGDILRGTAVAEAGERITVGRLCILAASGIDQIKVGRRPRISLLATGSELRRPGESLGPGQIYESNGVGLEALAHRAGAIIRTWPFVPDTEKATADAFRQAFEESDIVVTCGGVSVGDFDFVRKAFEQLGGTLEFWQVAIKPGKPFVFGKLGEKFLFGLPGNPVSALVTFLLLVRPAILRWQGARETKLPAEEGLLAETLNNPGNRRHFMRVRLGENGIELAGIQASHMLSSLAMSDGLVDVSPNTIIPAGNRVRLLRWE